MMVHGHVDYITIFNYIKYTVQPESSPLCYTLLTSPISPGVCWPEPAQRVGNVAF